MRKEDRKAALAAYRERKPAAGAYAIRCSASGEVWVGASPNLDTLQNRIWFTLRHGSNPHRSLQQAWNTHGADDFTFEELETLEDPPTGYALRKALEDRRAHWADRLAAGRI